MPAMRRVAVTGLGGVCALGTDVPSFWVNAKNGVCGITEITAKGGEEYAITSPAAPIGGWAEIAATLGREAGRADPFTQFAIKAADEAVADAGLEFDEPLAKRTAVLIGSGIGGQDAMDTAYFQLFQRGRKAHPLTILKTIPNAAASNVSIRFGLKGPSFAISSACASASHSIGVAADMIRMGRADAALAGAAEAVLTYGALEAWKAMHILSTDLCRPFSKNRNGLVIGEGAGILALEEMERAKSRGAHIYAELVGFGMNADGEDMINPATEGAVGAMRGALETAGALDPARTYVNAHGTGTLLNDPTETRAIRDVFGSGADDLAVSSTKSMHGHLLGAAGGIEAIAAIKALEEGVAPPTINLEEPDQDCDLDYVPNAARERDLDVAISNSFAFGGLNAVLAFRRV